MNLKLTIQYDGTRYNGWQRQGNTPNTIQGRIEEVLSRMVGTPVEIAGAGRTDAGVHALGQTANVRLPDGVFTPEQVLTYLNRYLPEDIGITDACEVPARFHSRLNAAGKRYLYRIGLGNRKNVFERRQIYPLGGELDADAMRRAAACFTGEHDFGGFSAGHTKKSTVRTLYGITLTELPDELDILFVGNGFLYNMVRILTGTLIEVGQGKRTPESVREALERRDRVLAGFTAPARGLTLAEVFYDAPEK